MIEIFIENKRLDVTQDLESLITYAIDDVRDFSSRNTSFSKTIVLPGTANNNKLFGSIFDAKISNPYDSTDDNVETNFNASVAADCIIFQNQMQVLKGTLRVLEIIVDGGFIEYEVAVFGELSGLVAALGSKRLEDIDFSAYNQTFNIANVSGSWANEGSGIHYPLIDYAGTSAAKTDWDVLAFRPAFFVKELIEKIFTASGYDYTCDLFSTTRFKRLIIPNNQARLASYSTKAFDADADVCTGPCTYDGDDVTPVKLSFGTINYAGDFTASLLNTRFTYGGTNQLNCSFTINLVGYLIAGSDVYFGLYKNGSLVDFSDPVTATGDFIVSKTFTGVSFVSTDYFEVKALVQSGSGSFSLTISSGDIILTTDTVQLVNLNYGEDIDMNAVIPRGIYQKDFLSSVVKLFNLYITEDAGKSKHLNIGPYTEYYDFNASGIQDWDYKIDRSRPLRIKPMSELNSRYYNFKFKSDVDYYNDLYQKTYSEGFGDYIYDSQYEFANEKTDIELIFASSPLIGYAGKDKLVVPMYKLDAGVEKATATNIRIMQKKTVSGVGSWSIKNGVTTLWTGTDYPYAGNYDDPDAPANDIHFGVPKQLYFTLASGSINVTQFNVYWSPYMAEITDKDSKLLTAYAKLSTADISLIDFSKLIYVDGCYWRLNKIEDWNVNFPDVCKVELLKVINTVY